jgi:hypothetical protein
VYVPPESPNAWGRKWAVCDPDWMVEAVKQSILELVSLRRQQSNAPEPGDATAENDGTESTPVSTEEAKKEEARKERRAEMEARLVSHRVNLNLGAELFTGLAQVELTYDLAVTLAELVIADDADALFLAGMRFCDPKIGKELDPPKNGGPAKLAYSFPEHGAQRAEYLMEFIKRADNGEQVIGRLLQVLGMAALADQTAVAQSNRQYAPTQAKKVATLVGDRLGAKLPVPIRERLDAEAKKAEEVAAQRAEWVAQRDAENKARQEAEDASLRAILEHDDKTEQAKLAGAHIVKYGDPDGALQDYVQGTEFDPAVIHEAQNASWEAIEACDDPAEIVKLAAAHAEKYPEDREDLIGEGWLDDDESGE